MKVLDHGYVTLVEAWGSDESIIQAARMSTDKGFLGWGPTPCSQCSVGTNVWGIGCIACKGTGSVPGDEKLLSYLWNNRHTTPFEMAGAIFEIQAPIMVVREWQRHRTQSYSELSARYTPLPDMNYVPNPSRCIIGSTANKQAGSSTDRVPTLDEAIQWLMELENVYSHAQSVYQRGLDLGIPKELARLPVPVGRYSRMRASANLWNWLHFLGLRRSSTKAQWEIAQYADLVESELCERFPRTMKLFAA